MNLEVNKYNKIHINIEVIIFVTYHFKGLYHTKRLQDMNIPLRDKGSPNLIVYSVDNMWVGFAKVHVGKPWDSLDL